MALVTEKENTSSLNKETKTAFEKFLTFKLGAESYGITVLSIREIIQFQNITPVPQMPDYVKGVINLRGKVIPVLDLRLKFCIGSSETTERTCIIVVQVESEVKGQTFVGLIVDAVEEVTNILDSEIEDKPELGNQVDHQYIMGIAKVKSEVKTLLHIERIILEEAAL